MTTENDGGRAAYERGRQLLEEGDLPGAINALERSVAQYPHFKTLELLGEAWLKSGEPLRAVVPLAAATTLNTQVRAPSLLAEALLRLGEVIEAHRVARLALDREGNNRKARAVLDATAAAYKRWSEPER